MNIDCINTMTDFKRSPVNHTDIEAPASFTEDIKKTPEKYTLNHNIDFYKSSFLTGDLEALNRDLEAQFALEKQKYGDDIFGLYGQAQDVVFNEKLQEMGFFDGMSEEEATQYKNLLHDITTIMNCVHLNPAPTVTAPNGAARFLYMGIFNEPEYSTELLSIYSDDAKLELESATSALNFFCENYVDEKNKQDFQSLINDFYTHNSKFLKNYQSMNEYLNQQHQKLITSGVLTPYLNRWKQWLSGQFQGQNCSEENIEYTKHMNSVSHTTEETSAYWKNIAALLSKLPQTDMDSCYLWKKIQEEHTAYLTGNTNHKGFLSITAKRTDTVFNQMKKYWGKMV